MQAVFSVTAMLKAMNCYDNTCKSCSYFTVGLLARLSFTFPVTEATVALHFYWIIIWEVTAWKWYSFLSTWPHKIGAKSYLSCSKKTSFTENRHEIWMVLSFTTRDHTTGHCWCFFITLASKLVEFIKSCVNRTQINSKKQYKKK